MIAITLDDGRVLELRPVEPHEAMQLAEGVDAPGTGREQKLSGNRVWWNRALQAAAVRSINGIPNPFPFSRTHIRGMIGDLGAAGVTKIVEALQDMVIAPDARAIEASPLSAVEELDLFELAGDYSDVPGWIAAAYLAAQVRKIDGAALAFPTTQDDVRARVERLGASGLLAAFNAVRPAEPEPRLSEVAAKN
ncbi:MAG TPA: hypothetical protein VNC39_07670 [Acidocella sp.]|jgi:hypothetical protein|uniref:hypothetical protein n=1 Tax=Acidocella sp. TaxID=50710 RepID=UPI002BB013F8|nr:hypothetical protein [Acidocella sp.]HVE21837.1 hypothetical protein [Acidocella sp.]